MPNADMMQQMMQSPMMQQMMQVQHQPAARFLRVSMQRSSVWCRIVVLQHRASCGLSQALTCCLLTESGANSFNIDV